jgi:hypothetical protein
MCQALLTLALVGTTIVAVAHGQTSSAPPTQAAEAAGSAAVSGTVTDAVSGRPLAGAIVSLRLTTGPARARNQRQVTDERGRFVFRDLPPGSGVAVVVTRLGYEEGGFGQSALRGPTATIALADGPWFRTADIQMWKAAAISGRVLDEFNEPVVGAYVRVLARHTVAGSPHLVVGPVAITDDRGEYRIAGLSPGTYLVHVPSVQATVPAELPAGALDASGGSADPTTIRPMSIASQVKPRTDAALDPVGSGRLLVGNFATPPPPADGRAQSYPMTFHPGASSPASANAIVVGLGEEKRGIDVAIRPVATSRIFGIVHGPAEALAGLVLRLLPAGLEDLGNGAEAATALVGADGTFAFLNVPAGAYIIDAPRSSLELTSDPGLDAVALPRPPGTQLGGSQSGSIAAAPAGVEYVSRSSAGDVNYWTRTPVSVDANDITNLVVTLQRGLTLSGTFMYEGSSRATIVTVPAGAGGVASTSTTTTVVQTTTTTGRPEMPPPIYAEPARGSASLGLPRRVFRRDVPFDDTFRIEGFKDGEYVLRVPSWNNKFTVKSITIDGSDYTDKALDVSRISRPDTVVITLTDNVTRLSGTVQTEQGTPAAAAVIVFPVERDRWMGYGFSPTRIRSVVVPPAATYEIVGLPAGDYHVVAVDQGLVSSWQDPAFLAKAAPAAARVTVDWGDAKTVPLKKAVIR